MMRRGDNDLFFEFDAAKRRDSRERVAAAAEEFRQITRAGELERLEELKHTLDVRTRQEHADDLRREYAAHGLEPIESPVLVSLTMMQKVGFPVRRLKKIQARKEKESQK